MFGKLFDRYAAFQAASDHAGAAVYEAFARERMKPSFDVHTAARYEYEVSKTYTALAKDAQDAHETTLTPFYFKGADGIGKYLLPYYFYEEALVFNDRVAVPSLNLAFRMSGITGTYGNTTGFCDVLEVPYPNETDLARFVKLWDNHQIPPRAYELVGCDVLYRIHVKRHAQAWEARRS